MKCYLCGKEKEKGTMGIVFEETISREEFFCDDCKIFKANRCPCGGTYYVIEELPEEGYPEFECEIRLKLAQEYLDDYLSNRMNIAPSFEGAIKLIFFLSKLCFCPGSNRAWAWDWENKIAETLTETFLRHLGSKVSNELHYGNFLVSENFFGAISEFFETLKNEKKE